MKYRKKPVIIEAIQFTGSGNNPQKILDWSPDIQWNAPDIMIIKTLEGEMTAQLGDYIIKGVKGEFYPCKPEIFEQTYEQVTKE